MGKELFSETQTTIYGMGDLGEIRKSGWGIDPRVMWLMVGERLADNENISDQTLEELDALFAYSRRKFAGSPHEFRHSGDHVLTHTLGMTALALWLGWDEADVLKTIPVHDVPEDTVEGGRGHAGRLRQTLEEIEQLAGREVVELVVPLTNVRSGKIGKNHKERARHETHRGHIQTILDSDTGKVTTKSFDRGRKMWEDKAVDIITNLLTIKYHTNPDGTPNLSKQLTKAWLALHVQVPIILALGLDNAARIIADLGMNITRPQAASLAQRRRALMETDKLENQVKGWLEKDENSDLKEGSFSWELPWLEEMIDIGWEDRLPTLVVDLADEKQVKKVFERLGNQYPWVNGVDVAGLYKDGAIPWKKVVVAEDGSRFAVELWCPESRQRSQTQQMEMLNTILLKYVSSESPVDYVRMGQILREKFSKVPRIEVKVKGNESISLNKGETGLDLIFRLHGLDGLLRLKGITLIRRGSNSEEQVLNPNEPLEPGDELMAYTLGRRGARIGVLEKVDGLSERHSSGALLMLTDWIKRHAEELDQESVNQRGYEIISWLYSSQRKKSLDTYPVLLMGDEVFLRLLDGLGRLPRRARNARDVEAWIEIAHRFEKQGVHPEDEDRWIVEVVHWVDELIKMRDRLPWVTIELDEDMPDVIKAIGTIMTRSGVSAMPFKGEKKFDAKRPLKKGAKVQILLRMEDLGRLGRIQELLYQIFPGAVVAVGVGAEKESPTTRFVFRG